MKKTLVLLAALVAFTGSAFGQQYYNISPKWIYEHQTMDSTHVGVVSADTIWFNKTAATKDVNLYRSSANRLRTSDSLTVDGNLTVTGTSTHTGIASFANGTAALPPIAGINDPNTGIRFPGVDTLAFSTGGSERMRIDPNGYVGIGTTGPATILDVVKDDGIIRMAASGVGTDALIRAIHTSGNAEIDMRAEGTAIGANLFGVSRNDAVELYSNNASNFMIGTLDAVNLTLGTNNTANVTIQSGGNVGIGTTSFGTSAAGVLGIGAGTAPSTSPADMSQIWTADRAGGAGQNAIHWRTEDGGAVGVLGAYSGFGTATPVMNIDVVGVGIPISGVTDFGIARFMNSASKGVIIGYDSSGTVGTIVASSVNTNSSLAFWTYNSGWLEAMRLAVNNLVIGATAAGSSAQKTLVLSNTSTAPSTSANLAHLYASDIGADSCVVAFWQELAPFAITDTTPTINIPVKWNGTTYYICAKQTK